MTTPAERMRSLRCCKQLFSALALEPAVSDDLRHQVQAIDRRFPDELGLKNLAGQGELWISQSNAQLFYETGVLLEDMQPCLALSEKTRKRLGGVLRHYPSREAGWRVAEHMTLMQVRDFLAPEPDQA